ncbi:MAG: M20/M25/M40 family metallo-hydrolase, partial [Acidobacteria bacterium]|nr:M20/M25/M40 family metallo-hydrolase [Acidobacteriota bacterium]
MKLSAALRSDVRSITSPNVVGILRGSDPTLRRQIVALTAHWDHLGIRPEQPGDNIYNGAIDNASGIAGMITVARALSYARIKPRRSVLFIATTAEEQGLLGAEYYLRHPLVPIT